MKRMLSAVLALAFMGANLHATDLNLSVQSSDGLSEISVTAGATVNYKITGVLSDDLNEGLALFGLDLVFDGGDLIQADSPLGVVDCLNPIPNFVIPEGITNPAGFGGTVILGDLVQIGGGQNTIKNTAANADFPIGTVFLGVAQPVVCGEAVLVTGTLTAPAIEGTYNLTIPLTSVFANVIRQGELVENLFLATDPAGVGTVSNLIINVNAPSCSITTATPSNCAIDARYPNDPGNAAIVFGLDSVDIFVDGGCDAASLLMGDFTVTSTAGVAPTITGIVPGDGTATLQLDAPIPLSAWTCFALGSSQSCVGYLPGDVLGDGTSTAADISGLIDNLNQIISLEMWQCDIDRSGECTQADILAGINELNGGGELDPWMGATLGACPSAP